MVEHPRRDICSEQMNMWELRFDNGAERSMAVAVVEDTRVGRVKWE